MVRSVWCFKCKMLMNTVVRDSHEVCQKCGTPVSGNSGGDASVVIDDTQSFE
jgi:hypothetical protein